jgi:DNA-binding response OmpR family regulator
MCEHWAGPTCSIATAAAARRNRQQVLDPLRLLLVEDNADLADLTSKGLSAAGYEVDAVATVADATHAVESNKYVTVILDLGLPDGDGETVLRSMRGQEDPTPVIVLTARGGLSDRVSGLEKGADDYLVKPFALEELVARVRALLRRPAQFLGKPLVAGNVAFDPIGRTVYVDDRPQTFSAREVALLEILMRRIGRVVPKKLAEDHLFGLSDEVRSNAIEVYVHRLRRQLVDAGARIQIHTVRGLGYLITESNG